MYRSFGSVQNAFPNTCHPRIFELEAIQQVQAEQLLLERQSLSSVSSGWASTDATGSDFTEIPQHFGIIGTRIGQGGLNQTM